MNLVLGFVLGACLSLANFVLLKRNVAVLIERQQTRAGLFLGAKLLPLLAVTAFLIIVLKMNPIALMAGFLTALIGAGLYEIRSKGSA